MKKYKRILMVFFCFCVVVGMPIIGYAANNSETISQVEEAQTIINQTLGINDEAQKDNAKEITDEDRKIYEAIYQTLTDVDCADITTIRGGYEIIDKIMLQIEMDKKGTFTSKWKSYFRKTGETYGLEMGSLKTEGYYMEDGTYVEGHGSESVEAGQLENSSVKVNILTWNKKDGLIAKEQGVIAELLQALELFGGFTTWVRGIAVALTITFGCTTLLTMVTDRNLSTEALQREFLKLLFGIWFIMNYKFFALLIIRLGTVITENVLSFSTNMQSYQSKAVQISLWESLQQMVTEYPNVTQMESDFLVGLGNVAAGIGASISNTVSAITSLFGGGFIQMISSLTVYAIAVEIGVRYLFTPIAIADLYSERFRSNGWMWMKKLFACSVQGAIIFVIIYVTNVLKNSINTFDPITNTAINLTMVGMFAKSRQIANDMIGVH